ncbi:MAG: ubiquinol-cytochrome c reductase iron-sulfur subunit [Sulfurimonas sp.]|uniref:ubiquinol-cytochrome c reductase iron-sulfur subunit n=1 Tax=Sulfurimonas sp. TaxID=2022749 RepID=UPI002603EE2A|nr:ubiquinol-cytochrome c reductase iron-sulfur subunit [Sulfurimonas sp.]MCW8895549.1 ubiquinol-cytochrome c reductase iron-sulfur subunit [Sulfurimonas sp.]MCW8954711.1 ubiquinol-cytochrome c reductase iron-sulfur subunit [Sulfurimonas sp.]MCW9067973.1 ubiquinol-cytochrome c reductase iron-sulfur subunit [Sulfurimonas sp.]
MHNSSRRGFMGKAFGAVAGVGAVGSLVAMKKTWDPLPSVKAAGFTTLDMSIYKENQLVTEKWRGKPIFVLKKTAAMVASQTDEQKERDIVVDGSHFMLAIGLCTHLGCIPAYKGEAEGFLCACHGGKFDWAGVVTQVPPPRGFDIPPFKIDGNKVILGEVGPEYKQMKETGITL